MYVGSGEFANVPRFCVYGRARWTAGAEYNERHTLIRVNTGDLKHTTNMY